MEQPSSKQGRKKVKMPFVIESNCMPLFVSSNGALACTPGLCHIALWPYRCNAAVSRVCRAFPTSILLPITTLHFSFRGYRLARPPPA